MTDDSLLPFCFPAIGRKKVTAAFDGGRLSSDGGVMLLAQAERRLGLAEQLAAVIPDGRDQSRVTHLLPDILRARIFAIACGYEDADEHIYDTLYCAPNLVSFGQMENLIKLHKSQLASDRTSCRAPLANQMRLILHTAAYWLMLTLRGLAPRTSFWRDAQFDTIRLCLIKVAGRVTEMVTRIKIALPTAYPYQIGFATLAGQIAKLPP